MVAVLECFSVCIVPQLDLRYMTMQHPDTDTTSTINISRKRLHDNFAPRTAFECAWAACYAVTNAIISWAMVQ